jgi:hypothetical protein
MADRPRMTAAQLVDKLASEHADMLRERIAWLAAELMEAEVASRIGAELGERAPDRRTTQRNGRRPRTWDTRVGQLKLTIPKLCQGSWAPGGAAVHLRRHPRHLRRPTATEAASGSARSPASSAPTRQGRGPAGGLRGRATGLLAFPAEHWPKLNGSLLRSV